METIGKAVRWIVMVAIFTALVIASSWDIITGTISILRHH